MIDGFLSVMEYIIKARFLVGIIEAGKLTEALTSPDPDILPQNISGFPSLINAGQPLDHISGISAFSVRVEVLDDAGTVIGLISVIMGEVRGSSQLECNCRSLGAKTPAVPSYRALVLEEGPAQDLLD